jgi:DnaJ-domain-containing protein 1
MEEILGTHAEPDPLFFVDSWTMGLEAATESLQARRHPAKSHDAPVHSAFDFQVPVAFIPVVFSQDAPRSADFSTFTPIGFREAYGVPAPSLQSAAPGPQKFHRPEPPSSVPDPAQPLTLQSAYSLLGVADPCSREQIKSAYRQLVRRYHPDRLPSSTSEERRIATDRMTAINQAYHLLCSSPSAA